MGSTGAMGMAWEVSQGTVSLQGALIWHLQSNHYPPLPVELVPVAMRAIAKANKEQWHTKVLMPKGISFRGLKLAPVGDLIEALHLDSFLSIEGGY